jgi:hypothetical protein
MLRRTHMNPLYLQFKRMTSLEASTVPEIVCEICGNVADIRASAAGDELVRVLIVCRGNCLVMHLVRVEKWTGWERVEGLPWPEHLKRTPEEVKETHKRLRRRRMRLARETPHPGRSTARRNSADGPGEKQDQK